MDKIELLAPAGNLEKLKMAIIYGADAVYLGGEAYGLRAYADNFSLEEMKEGIEYAHSRGKRVYVTMNIIPHNSDLIGIQDYAAQMQRIGADALILSDPGIFMLVKEAAPEMEIHLSTQANNTNWASAQFWYEHGIKRIILARELSLKEIGEIRHKVNKKLELEIFIHGAMCISYSGRCLLSNYMAGRDSNKGLCAHPCRWKYFLMEEKRPGEYMPVFENESGTFIFNSKDLCMIEHIPEIIQAGVTSVKIEGRMKSSYYVATVVRAYRKVIDSYCNDPESYRFDPMWMEEISKASHREYTTGFYFKKPGAEEQVYNTSSYIRDYDFVGLVRNYDKATGIATVEQRNRMFNGEEIEVVIPGGEYFTQVIESMKNEDGENIDSAPHPQMTVYMPMAREVAEYAILRRKPQYIKPA
ncbi:MAG TPA: U32 family peptidase C-terminal domain-containing protein [Clostridiales bacterium]|nr:U32 family peptidase C-terminal domain-containing protein [Clostridiales bacterium]